MADGSDQQAADNPAHRLRSHDRAEGSGGPTQNVVDERREQGPHRGLAHPGNREEQHDHHQRPAASDDGQTLDPIANQMHRLPKTADGSEPDAADEQRGQRERRDVDQAEQDQAAIRDDHSGETGADESRDVPHLGVDGVGRDQVLSFDESRQHGRLRSDEERRQTTAHRHHHEDDPDLRAVADREDR